MEWNTVKREIWLKSDQRIMKSNKKLDTSEMNIRVGGDKVVKVTLLCYLGNKMTQDRYEYS